MWYRQTVPRYDDIGIEIHDHELRWERRTAEAVREKGSFMEAAILLASYSHEFGAAGGWWPIFPLLWFALIVGGFFFFGSRMRRGVQQHPFRSGEAVLAERYARGEVTEEEYRERLAVLRQRRQ